LYDVMDSFWRKNIHKSLNPLDGHTGWATINTELGHFTPKHAKRA
jgi:hypothetical protein